MRHVFMIVVGLLLSASWLSAQTVSGTVTDAEDGSPIQGAAVLVKDYSVGTLTDENGKYKIDLPTNAEALIFRFVGKSAQTVSIDGRTTINVSMAEDVLEVEEVVVTAIGIEREKKSLGYSVQEVGGDALVQSREPNLMGALAGKVAGLQVNSSNGTPGGGVYFLLRGSTSFNDANQPLVVIDGVPVDNSTNYTGDPNNTARNNNLQGVTQSNRGIDINPNDIQEITVLKGPAAAALYGSRAANGAIMITTKRGGDQGGRMRVNFKTSLGFDQVNKLPEVQKTYAQGSRGAYNNRTSLSWGPRIDTLGEVVNPIGETVQAQSYENDFNNFFQTGVVTDNALSFSGGNIDNNFYTSVGYLRQTGIIPNTDFTRYSVRFNGESKVARHLKARVFANYTNSGGQRIQQGSNLSNPLFTLWPAPASWDLYGIPYENADGTMNNYRNFFDNPRWAVEKNPYRDNVDRMLGNIQLSYDPADWLNVLYRVGTDVFTDRRKQIMAIGSWEANTIGRVYEEQISSSEINSDFIVNLTPNISDKFEFGLTLGNNINVNRTQRLFVQGDGLTIPGFYNLSNATGIITTDQLNRSRGVSVYADARFSYDNYLFLSITGRNEWTSTLPLGDQSFFYPSASLGFVFTDAFKMKESGFLPYGKVRMSYAQTGNGAPIYSTQSVYTSSTPGDGWTSGLLFPLGGTIPGFTLSSTTGNPLLVPEITNAFEAGIELKFAQNRAGIDFAYYAQESLNQIFPQQVSSASGSIARIVNAGRITNNGFEIQAYGTPIRSDNFEWRIDVNFTRNVSLVDYIDEDTDEGIQQLTIAGFTAPQTVIARDQPYGALFGSAYARDDAGNILIDDNTASPTYGLPIQSPTNQIIGNTQPDFLMGLRNTFAWKGFRLSSLLDFRKGGDIYAGTTRLIRLYGAAKETEDRTTPKVLPGVKASDGSVNDIAVPLGQTYYQNIVSNVDEANVFDASWLRLREVTLSYTLPGNLLEKTPFRELTISATGRNLWLDTKYPNLDPEVSLTGANYGQGLEYMSPPATKGYTFSLNLSF
ncbi:MAG: SusC/RagA family TonB-linked outer membrane protein [Bacteroidia bacterium]